MEDGNMQKLPVAGEYMGFALPVIVSMLVGLINSLLDTYFITGTGNVDLIAGVSVAAPVLTLMVALGDVFGLGGSSVISRLLGASDEESAKRVSVFCFYGALLLGIISTTVLVLFERQFLSMLGAGGDTVGYAAQYYRYIAYGAPLMLIFFTPCNLLRVEGFSGASMAGGVLANVVNIILDPVLIYGFEMGAAGAAIATVAGYAVSDAFFICFVLKKSRFMSVSIFELSLKKVLVREVLAIGLPAAAASLTVSFSTVLLNNHIAAYGSAALAAMGVVLKIYTIPLYVIRGFAVGGQPLMGYCQGAGDLGRLKKIMKFAYVTDCALAVAFAVLFSIFAGRLVGLFLTDPELIEEGALMLRCLQPGLACTAFVMVSISVFQSVGRAFDSAVLSLGRQGYIFWICINFMSRVGGYYGILLSQSAADFVAGIAAVILLNRYVMDDSYKIDVYRLQS